MVLLLQLRTKPSYNHRHHHPLTTNPSFLFSSSFSSYFRDLRHTLKQQSSPSTPPTSSSFTNSHKKQQPSRDEILRNLSEFRRRTAGPSPPEPVSFLELYNRTVTHKPSESEGDSGSGHAGKPFSLDGLRESLRKIGADHGGSGDRNGADRISFAAYKDALRLRPSDSAAASSPEKVFGGTTLLPESVFGREMREKRERGEMAASSEFLRIYSYGELGEKLRKLRPAEGKGRGKEWFSIEELNERLMRLREMEARVAESNINGGVSFRDFRECLIRINDTNAEKLKKSSC